MCRKIKYKKMSPALRKAELLSDTYNTNMYIHFCEVCYGFHLTKKRPSGKKKKELNEALTNNVSYILRDASLRRLNEVG